LQNFYVGFYMYEGLDMEVSEYIPSAVTILAIFVLAVKG